MKKKKISEQFLALEDSLARIDGGELSLDDAISEYQNALGLFSTLKTTLEGSKLQLEKIKSEYTDLSQLKES